MPWLQKRFDGDPHYYDVAILLTGYERHKSIFSLPLFFFFYQTRLRQQNITNNDVQTFFYIFSTCFLVNKQSFELQYVSQEL